MLNVSTGRGPRPAGGGFETFSWYYFRVSGVALVFLVIVHLFIMHVSNDVSCTTYAFIAYRYSNVFWRLFDWLLLILALTHGMNGLRVVIDDYVRTPSARVWFLSICAILLLTFFMLGTITLITFQPAANVGAACIHG
jgi:succinate dehydrogenase / fumarate reductase membrane anchor subunit